MAGLMVRARTALADMLDATIASIRPAVDAPGGRPLPGAVPPLPQVAQEGIDPRAAQIPYGFNLVLTPRQGTGKSLTPFQTLRQLSDFDLIRIAIEDVKNQIRGMDWEVRVRPHAKDLADALKPQLDIVRAFCEKPDLLAGIEWPEWIGMAVEEVLVTDALTLLPRFDVGGRLIGLEQIDGATIIPYVDDRGRPPLPPAAAFGQVIYGQIETDWTMSELIYAPRARRADSPYGRSNVENVLYAANLALRQQLHELAWYSSGNVPDGGFWSVPDTWTPEQIEAAQKNIDTMTAGNMEARSGYLRFMPGGKYVSVKDRQWSYEFLEWLARVIAWSFGVSPIPIAKQINRATAQTLERSSMENGPRPISAFIASVINRALRVHAGIVDVEFAWAEDETDDAQVVFSRNVAYLNSGAMNVNEVRATQGLEALPYDTPNMISTPTGPVLLEQLIDEMQNPPEPAPTTPPAPLDAAPSGAPGATEGTTAQPPVGTATGQEKAWHAAFARYRSAVADDLRKWRDVLAKGKRRQFQSAVIPLHVRQAADADLRSLAAAFKREMPISGKRRKAERRIVEAFRKWLKRTESRVLPWAVQRLPLTGKVAKDGEPDYDASSIGDELVAALSVAGEVGAGDASAAIGVNLESVPAGVVEYARTRAGELIGKQLVAGEWIDSKSGSAITDTLRRQVEDAIRTAIEERQTPAELRDVLAQYFDESRAETIARTETGYAYGNGAAEVYGDNGIDMVVVHDGPGCLPFGHDDSAPASSEDEGVVESDAQAEGQIWTLAQYQGAILGHPNCVRVAVPYFASSASEREAA